MQGGRIPNVLVAQHRHQRLPLCTLEVGACLLRGCSPSHGKPKLTTGFLEYATLQDLVDPRDLVNRGFGFRTEKETASALDQNVVVVCDAQAVSGRRQGCVLEDLNVE